ncbi:hypothetical protein SAMN02746000_02833 [Paracoccus sp. J56]|nr:hypothetical protein SAMN02746000_02833 [Paracoccus sp. J56]
MPLKATRQSQHLVQIAHQHDQTQGTKNLLAKRRVGEKFRNSRFVKVRPCLAASSIRSHKWPDCIAAVEHRVTATIGLGNALGQYDLRIYLSRRRTDGCGETVGIGTLNHNGDAGISTKLVCPLPARLPVLISGCWTKAAPV